MDRREVEAKGLDLMGPVLGGARARRVVERVRGLERVRRAADLAALLRA